MKLTRTTYNLILCFIAGVAALLIIVGAVGMKMQKDSRYALSDLAGVKPDAVVMTVGGREIDAETYLGCLAYYCGDYDLHLRHMDINPSDWETVVDDGFTFGDMLVQNAESMAKKVLTEYNVIDALASETDVTLTETDLAAIEAQLAASAEYQQADQVERAFLEQHQKYIYLSDRVVEIYGTAGSPLYPGESAIDDYIAAGDYLTASILFIDTCEMDDAQKSAALQEMRGYVQTLRNAEDKDAAFTEIAKTLNVREEVTTFSGNAAEAPFVEALKTFAPDTVSDVISTEEGYYVAIPKALDRQAVVSRMFRDEYVERCQSTEVTYCYEVFDSIQSLTFYQKLLSKQGSSVT